ncbi:B3 domain-containing protein At3g06220-like [Solanum tuberosum]|uniref:B3 domain-containing protein At3g06220-like n=1 Tax=Solanum tuberosum TaxID=4113 RepID=UPI00073A3D3E|nr:PREDICTED: B3 domain-containing protein At3g06220-like [Solanum tuberosum]
MEKGFFKVFIPEISAKRLKLPTGYTDYKNGILPRNIFLRDQFENMWRIGVTKSGKDIYFEYGWEKFIKDNIVELGDFFIFDYDGTRIFDFKLLGRNGCVKKGDGGLKHVVKKEEAEEINVKHQKSVEPKVNTRARDSKNISSSNVRDGNNMAGEKDDEEKESKCKSMTAGKVNNPHDQFATDIFRSGRATKPKNPYFVTKIRPDRRNHLYVPADMVRDYQLELPSSMTIRDSAGREFEAKLKIWQDGRIWLIGGWHSLCNHLGLDFEINFTQKWPDAVRQVVPLIGRTVCQAVRQPG